MYRYQETEYIKFIYKVSRARAKTCVTKKKKMNRKTGINVWDVYSFLREQVHSQYTVYNIYPKKRNGNGQWLIITC